MATLILQILLGFLSAIWLLQTGVFWLNASSLKRLLDTQPPEPETWPRLSVVVPAKDEAATIESAIRTRLADDYPDLEIVIVDDRSGDATPAIAAELAELDPRVRYVRIDELPDGWLGKVNAMRRGYEVSTGEWVLFSDADVHVEPGTSRRAVAYSIEAGLGHMGLIPEYQTQSWMVDSLWSVFLRILMIMLSPKRIADPKTKTALGSGAFNLVSREAFEATPGFEWLKLDTTDDMSMALMIKQAGFRTEGLDGRDAASVLIYRDLREFFSGTQKNAGVLLGARLPLFMVGVASWLLLEWAPLLAPIAGALTGSTWLLTIGLLSLLAAVSVNTGALYINTKRIAAGLAWPIGSAIFAFTLVRALRMAEKSGGVYWRDTFYSKEELLAERKFKL